VPVGVYPETKNPSHFRERGLPLEPPLLAELDRGLEGAPVYIQSFEAGNLVALREQCAHPLVQLLEPGAPADLAAIARYAQAIGVHKSTVVAPDTGESTGLAARAHAAGLALHAWALRAENRFLGKRWQRGPDPAAHGDLAGEIAALVAAGADGLFCDQPAEAVRALGMPLATDRTQD
jgi:glycerophosphoryl diester phosphodiesterase